LITAARSQNRCRAAISGVEAFGLFAAALFVAFLFADFFSIRFIRAVVGFDFRLLGFRFDIRWGICFMKLLGWRSVVLRAARAAGGWRGTYFGPVVTPAAASISP